MKVNFLIYSAFQKLLFFRPIKKGHRYIVLAQGPARPIGNTQAAPVLPIRQTSTDFPAFTDSIFAGLERNA